MYKGYNMVAWPTLAQDSFFLKMDMIIKTLHTERKQVARKMQTVDRKPIFKSGVEFNEHVKTIMAKINHSDWSSLSAQFVTNRIEVIQFESSKVCICILF